MKPVSVGRMSPPPSSTWHLHMPHEPPPPQAEGRKTLLLASVVSSVEPLSVVMTFSPSLMSIGLRPNEVSFAFAKSSSPTSRRVTTRKAMIAMIIDNSIFLLILRLQLNPEKVMKAIPIRPVR